ncbi:unnamed protein product [Schistosoma turkestanicum]|nr:unnamed protein product [Schistosoma turkestanicum]
MPAKRRFASRFPTTRIKKIMQLDEEIGKLTATVPPVVSKAISGLRKINSLNRSRGPNLGLLPANKAGKMRKNGKAVGNSSNGSVSFDSSGIRNESLVDYQYTEA